MIISKAMDVEIFINLFSVCFVDMKDYLNTFADCIDEKGNPIPLTSKLPVEEIENRLAKVKSDTFVITDTDNSQLLELVAYINNMQAHYDTTIKEDGSVVQTPIRYDVFTFNGLAYDNNMIRAFMMYFNRCESTKYLLEKLKHISNKLIDLQNDKEAFYKDKEIETIKSYKLPYASVDIQQVYGLHSAGVNIDKETKERKKFGKGLKQTSINLKWHNLLDFEIPPIDEEEYKLYWSKQDESRGLSLEELNILHKNSFDRYILPKYVVPMVTYNKNDVYLVCEAVRQKPEEVKLRYSISRAFGINVLSSARANIADNLMVKFYAEISGLKKDAFIKGRTERTRLSFDKIIFPHIQFKTKQLQDVLTEMKKVYVYHTTKDDFQKEITFYDTTYTLACGGIHTQDRPCILVSDNNATYIHFDYNSYYPSIIVSYDIAPKHLNKKVFVELVKYFRDTRVKCKHTPDSEGYVIEGVPNKIAAEALKIVINSIYGKFGSDVFFLYDRFAQLQVTINGQLMTMTLVEELELNGIHVISANTDGIVIKLPNDKREIFKEITERWNKTNKMGADSEEYECLYSRDVNNYFAIWSNGKFEAKGDLDPKQYIKDLKKGYDAPIVPIAIYNYLYKHIPVMDTLRNHKDILDFCKTQNVGKRFVVCYDKIVDGELKTIYTQKHVRYYVSTKGVRLNKEDNYKHRTKFAGGLPVQLLNKLDNLPIEQRNIDYKYYYEEAYKIIDPIKLGISTNQKADVSKGVISGRLSIKRKQGQYLSLFDDEDF